MRRQPAARKELRTTLFGRCSSGQARPGSSAAMALEGSESLPVKAIEYIDVNDTDNRCSARIVNPPPGEKWTPCERGTRTARSGIPEKGLPADKEAFRAVFSLFSSPNKTEKVPWESFNDQEALKDLTVVVKPGRDYATAQVSSQAVD